jgi:hypothetical protein
MKKIIQPMNSELVFTQSMDKFFEFKGFKETTAEEGGGSKGSINMKLLKMIENYYKK